MVLTISIAAALASMGSVDPSRGRVVERGVAEVVMPDGRLVEAERLVVWRRLCMPVSPGVDVSGAVVVPARSAGPGVLVRSSAERGAGLTLEFNATGALTPEIVDALQFTADYYASLFADPVTVRLDIEFGSGGGLGAAAVTFFALPYEEYRAALIADADADDVVPGLLPAGSFPVVRSPGGAVMQETTIVVTTANLRAIGVTAPDDVDAQIFVAGDIDFDPSDGITAPPGGRALSGVDVLVHEVGHALGFVNVVEFGIDFGAALDLQRFPVGASGNPGVPASGAEFGVFPRALFVGFSDGHAFADTVGEFAMSNGTVYQASHWDETGAAGFNGRIGVMEPAIAFGENGFPDFFSDADLRAFDAIGWDIATAAPCVADLAAPFGELTFADVSFFLSAFAAQDPAADLAAPAGQFTFADVGAFLGAFSAGCP